MPSYARQPCLILLSALVAVKVFGFAGTVVRAEGRKLAVVVGVDAYRVTSGLPNLRYASRDAAALSEALRSNGYSVVEMTHAAARRPGKETHVPLADYIRDQLSLVLDTPNLGADDAIVFSLHGHGVQFDLIEEDGKKTPRFYFCPADAKVAGIGTANNIADHHHLLPLEDLYRRLGDSQAATKLLIMDACRNDPSRPTVFRSGLASSTLPKLPPPPGGSAAFFSCKANEQAVEDPKLKHGVFTHFLVKGLEGKADQKLAGGQKADGVVTFAELSAYVANNTYAHSLKVYGVKQSPELRGHFDLNLPLARGRKRLARPALLAIPFSGFQAAEQQKAWSLYLGEPVEFSNSLGGRMRLVPPGRFRMGSTESSPAPNQIPHSVSITRPFYAGVHEVTRGEFQEFVRATGYRTTAERFDNGTNRGWDSGSRRFVNARGFTWNNPGWRQEENHPVVNVTWNDADRFVEWLSKKEGQTYRLLTEAEWEYCCRSGSSSRYSFGNDHNQLTRHGNVLDYTGWNRFASDPRFRQQSVNDRIASDDRAAFTTPVGSYQANPLGLYDFHGNVCEWCHDWYKDQYYQLSEKDPRGPANGVERCARGGRFDTGKDLAKAFQRNRGGPGMSDMILGFRVAMEIEP